MAFRLWVVLRTSRNLSFVAFHVRIQAPKVPGVCVVRIRSGHHSECVASQTFISRCFFRDFRVGA